MPRAAIVAEMRPPRLCGGGKLQRSDQSTSRDPCITEPRAVASRPRTPSGGTRSDSPGRKRDDAEKWLRLRCSSQGRVLIASVPCGERNRCATGRATGRDSGLVLPPRRRLIPLQSLREAPQGAKEPEPTAQAVGAPVKVDRAPKGAKQIHQGQADSMFRPLRGSRVSSRSTHGLRRGLRFFRAFGAPENGNGFAERKRCAVGGESPRTLPSPFPGEPVRYRARY